MNPSRYWPLLVLLLGLAGCTGTSPASTSGGQSAAQWIENGNAALARGEFEEAVDYFGKALGAQADSALAHDRRAAAFLHLKKFDNSLYDCNEALKIDRKLASAYFTRGLAEIELGDAEKALDDFGNALDNGLERVDVLSARGGLYYSLAKAKTGAKSDEAAKFLEKALKDFERAVKLDPRQVGPRVQRAAIYLAMGDYEATVADCNAALDVDANLAAIHVLRARGECELGEIDKAIIDCDSAIHLDDKLIEAYAVRAMARLERSSEMRTLAEVADCRQAVTDCQAAIERSKKFHGDAEGAKHAKTLRGLAHELRGSIYQNLGAVKEALAEYERALSLDPYLVSALLRRGDTRSASEDFIGALADCNTAVGIDSARPEAYDGRGLVHYTNKEYAKAVEDFNQAVALNRKFAKAYSHCASVYLAMALQEFTKAQELARARRPADQAEIDSGVAKAKELLQKCIDTATQAIAANHHLARAYFTRGIAYDNQQAADKALADFSAAIREDPKMARAYYNRAMFYAKHLLLKKAADDLLEMSKLQPNNPLIDYRLYQIYQKMGDPVLTLRYKKSFEEKMKRRRPAADETLLLDPSADITAKRKAAPDLQPDIDLDPLDEAKKELKKTLDETAER